MYRRPELIKVTPNEEIEISLEDFTVSLYNALRDFGALVYPKGPTPRWNAQPTYWSDIFLQSLLQARFESILEYDDATFHLGSPWSFAIALKAFANRANWLRNEAETNIELWRRVVTVDGRSPLKYYDGATYMTHMFPNRIAENQWCNSKSTGTCGGHGLDPEKPNFPASAFEVRQSGVSEHAGRGIYAKTFIPKGSYLENEMTVHSMFMFPRSYHFLERNESPFGYALLKYMDFYGWYETFYATGLPAVEPGVSFGLYGKACVVSLCALAQIIPSIPAHDLCESRLQLFV